MKAQLEAKLGDSANSALQEAIVVEFLAKAMVNQAYLQYLAAASFAKALRLRLPIDVWRLWKWRLQTEPRPHWRTVLHPLSYPSLQPIVSRTFLIKTYLLVWLLSAPRIRL